MAKSGRHPRVKGQPSKRVITVKVTEGERAELEKRSQIASLTLSDFIRRAALGHREQKQLGVPEINREAYVALARSAANINQLAHHLNEGRITGLNRTLNAEFLREMLRRMYGHIQALRRLMIGGLE